MKRLLAFVIALVPLAFWAGRRGNRQRPQPQPIVLKAPDVYIGPQLRVASDQSQGRLERYKLHVDPYILLIVTLISVVLSGLFAGLTWSVNRNQEELLKRQTEVQASQALPVFILERELADELGVITEQIGGATYRSTIADGTDDTEYLRITNQGGIARNIAIQVYTVIRVTWATNDTMEPEELVIPLDGYGARSLRLSGMRPSQVLTFGRETNYEAFLGVVEAAIPIFYSATEDEMSTFEIYPGWYVTVEYQDYQGNDRSEFYSVVGYNYFEDGNERTPSEMVPPEEVDEFFTQYDQRLADGQSVTSQIGGYIPASDVAKKEQASKLVDIIVKDILGHASAAGTNASPVPAIASPVHD